MAEDAGEVGRRRCWLESLAELLPQRFASFVVADLDALAADLDGELTGELGA
ncbi:MAG TPA: hypothetical protein VMD59_17675 [Acidimicrobiales bacterium]|nr:hypothetical protein [Acidimicrobiales bacterium]